MVHRIAWRVGSEDALSSGPSGSPTRASQVERGPATAALRRPRGARARARGRRERRRAADRRRTPRSRPSTRCRASTASAPTRADPGASAPLLERGARRFEPSRRRLGGARRAAAAAPTPTTRRRTSRGIQGAGTVHHIAWAHADRRARGVARAGRCGAGGRPTPVIDRFYFQSVYFREPSGVLFEIATIGPGFTTDEPLEQLGERLVAAARLRAPARADRGDGDAAAADAAGQRALESRRARPARRPRGPARRGRPRRRPRVRRAQPRAVGRAASSCASRQASQLRRPASRRGAARARACRATPSSRSLSSSTLIAGLRDRASSRSAPSTYARPARGGCRDDLGQAASEQRRRGSSLSATSAASARSSAAR